MDEVLVFLANIPGLILFLLFAGGLMISLELKKIIWYRYERKVDWSGILPSAFPMGGLFYLWHFASFSVIKLLV